jgi:glycoprotein endo-alpha-1,2-mannosidase
LGCVVLTFSFLLDVTTLTSILSHPDIGGLKVALFYETTGRIPLFKTGSPNLSKVASDIEYMAKTYFKHPNYLRIENRPVLVIYLTRSMPSLVKVINLMREAAMNTGNSLYIIGDEAFGKAPTSRESLKYLDGIANYDVYGSLYPGGYYAGQSTVDAYFTQQRKWRSLANAAGKGYIPGITPGYNDLGIRNVGHAPLSRQLDASSDFGSLFRSMIKQALPIVDERAKRIMLITSWNEWMEDTMIEPVMNGTGVTKCDVSSSGQFYTKGIKYDDYGELYLNILKEETFFSPSNSSVMASFATELIPVRDTAVLGRQENQQW